MHCVSCCWRVVSSSVSAVGGSPSCAWRVGKSCVWDWRWVWRELRREVIVVDVCGAFQLVVRPRAVQACSDSAGYSPNGTRLGRTSRIRSLIRSLPPKRVQQRGKVYLFLSLTRPPELGFPGPIISNQLLRDVTELAFRRRLLLCSLTPVFYEAIIVFLIIGLSISDRRSTLGTFRS